MMREGSMSQDIKEEAEWIKSTLMKILHRHAIQIRVVARSKGWWTLEVEAKRKEYVRIRRLYQQGKANVFTLKVERNSCYYTI